MAKETKNSIKEAKPSSNQQKIEEVTLTCGCNRDITLVEFGKIYKSQKQSVIEKFLPYINKTLETYNITSCLRKAHFLAQVGHESGQLSYIAEQLEKGVQEKDIYDGYKGRGLLQLTYKPNYVSYGNFVGHDFTENNKSDLENTNWASDSAGWYWTKKQDPGLNEYADKNDIIYITQAINGAFNGYDDRHSLLKNSATALLIDNCPNQSTCWNMNEFNFENSAAYNISGAAFGWGLWHDPSSNRSGVVKSIDKSIIGYRRFIELKDKQQKKRFGFKSVKEMIEHAELRISNMEHKK